MLNLFIAALAINNGHAPSIKGSDDHSGFTVGLGLEVKLTGEVSYRQVVDMLENGLAVVREYAVVEHADINDPDSEDRYGYIDVAVDSEAWCAMYGGAEGFVLELTAKGWEELRSNFRHMATQFNL